MNQSFQKCVKGVYVEKGWKGKRPLPIVYIELIWKSLRKNFHYAPRYYEVKQWLQVMIFVMGKDEVEKELDIKLGENYDFT